MAGHTKSGDTPPSQTAEQEYGNQAQQNFAEDSDNKCKLMPDCLCSICNDQFADHENQHQPSEQQRPTLRKIRWHKDTILRSEISKSLSPTIIAERQRTIVQ